jgi:hypothetical protein
LSYGQEKCANDELLSYFQVEAPIHRPSFFLFFSLTIKDKTNISLTIKILHLGQGSFTRKVRTIFTLKIIVSIFVKIFLILVLHLRQFFIVRIFVKRATGFQKGDNLKTNRTHPLHNLPERVQILGHAHIICITVVHNRIICCQIFCDLLMDSAFERIVNVMQLILIKLSGILSKNI